jgi:hypothetical protein
VFVLTDTQFSFGRSSEGGQPLQQIAAVGMAALLVAGHPQKVLAADLNASAQVLQQCSFK